MSGVPFAERYREATLVLVSPDGVVLGKLPAIRLDEPWLQEIGALVERCLEMFDLEVTILRLLSVDDSPDVALDVEYLGEVAAGASSSALEPWHGTLTDDPLRLPYAEVGGPAADIAWATGELESLGAGTVTAVKQVRTWNLSAISQLKTMSGDSYWLKAVPPFFAHEGDVIRLLASEPVPVAVAHLPGRLLLQHLPGEDCYNANVDQMKHMVTTLVDLQWRWRERLNDLQQAGVPVMDSAFLAKQLPVMIERNIQSVSEEVQAQLHEFLGRLPGLLEALDSCGLPTSLVHGDYHPGNWRGSGLDLTILDWGDCVVGNPLLDLPGLLERAPDHAEELLVHWTESWRRYLPHVDLARGIGIARMIASARMALVYQHFLDNIEESEQIYHDTDPAMCLTRVAELFVESDAV